MTTDYVRKFAETVAPLYVAHDWLGLRYLPHGVVIDELESIARGLFERVVQAANDRPGQRYFAATARMIATYEPWDDGADEIRLGLDLETFVRNGDEFINLYDPRLDD